MRKTCMPPTIRFRHSAWLVLPLLLGGVGSLWAVAPAESTDLTAAWRLGAKGDFGEAAVAIPAELAGEDARFTAAMLLFNRQPRSDENLVKASALLAALAQDGTTPEAQARSRYFQARAETLLNPDGPEEIRLYEQLWRDHPAQAYGQRGLVQLLLIAFYEVEPREVVLAKVAQIEAQAGGGLTDPVVRSQFHQVVARGYLHLGGADALALEHLLQVDALGVARREALGDLHVSIGQLAAEQGRTALAREHYQTFLREFPNDPRVYTVKAFMAALPN